MILCQDQKCSTNTAVILTLGIIKHNVCASKKETATSLLELQVPVSQSYWCHLSMTPVYIYTQGMMGLCTVCMFGNRAAFVVSEISRLWTKAGVKFIICSGQIFLFHLSLTKGFFFSYFADTFDNTKR